MNRQNRRHKKHPCLPHQETSKTRIPDKKTKKDSTNPKGVNKHKPIT